MKTQLLLMLASSAMLFSSCSSDDDMGPVNPEKGSTEVQFDSKLAASVSPRTRMADNKWEANDAIGVFMFKADTDLVKGNNKKYITTGDGHFKGATPSDVLHYPEDESVKVDFVTYYPRTDDGIHYYTNEGVCVPISVSDQDNPAAIDFLASEKLKGKDRFTSTLDLDFKHKLSKLVFNIKLEAGNEIALADLKDMTVTVTGTKAESHFSLWHSRLVLKPVVYPYPQIKDIMTKVIDAGERYEAIILPAKFANSGDVTFKFTLNNTNNDEFVWSVPATEFREGTQYTYDVTMSITQIEAIGTIQDWTEENETINIGK